MELRKTHEISALHDQCIGVCDVYTTLDDGGRNEHIEVSFPETNNDIFE